MNDTVRPELSKKSEYWIPKHRYYELKHFCQQYPEWKAARAWIDGFSDSQQLGDRVQTSTLADRTADSAQLRIVYSDRIDMVDNAAEQADPELAYFIRKGVTEGYSYEALRLRFNMPCGRETYYDRYRKFFWHLHLARN